MLWLLFSTTNLVITEALAGTSDSQFFPLIYELYVQGDMPLRWEYIHAKVGAWSLPTVPESVVSEPEGTELVC